MALSLPAPVSAYFRISNGEEGDRIADVFAPDATVRDEGQTWQGARPSASGNAPRARNSTIRSSRWTPSPMETDWS